MSSRSPKVLSGPEAMRYRTTVKFTLQNEPGKNLVRACTADQVIVREHEIRRSAILTADHIVFDWPPLTAEALTPADVEAVLALEPEVILLGTGARQRFPHPAIARAVQSAGVGFEVMDTPAACRTYNVLVQEGRRVAAAILIEAAPSR